MYEAEPKKVRQVSLKEYKRMKMKMLKQFCIYLTDDEKKYMNSLKNEIKVDQFCISKIMNY